MQVPTSRFPQSDGANRNSSSHSICIAGARVALILHCTYAAIAGTVPDQLIPASTVETAIAWTRWELSQTLLQYQKLGLTDDPELSRILKFIDKFTGKGWVSTANVRSWWTNKSDRTVENIRQFMAKVVGLGYAIDNEGDRAKLGDDTFKIDRIEDDFIGGTADDGSYIGGNINSVQSIAVDESPPIPNGHITKDIGGGFKEIISNHSAADTTTEEGGIEYDC